VNDIIVNSTGKPGLIALDRNCELGQKVSSIAGVLDKGSFIAHCTSVGLDDRNISIKTLLSFSQFLS